MPIKTQVVTRDTTTGEIGSADVLTFPQGTGLMGVGAVTGFAFLPTSAAAPTGVPAAVPTGFVAACFCTGDNKLYIYDGAWLASAALT